MVKFKCLTLEWPWPISVGKREEGLQLKSILVLLRILAQKIVDIIDCLHLLRTENPESANHNELYLNFLLMKFDKNCGVM